MRSRSMDYPSLSQPVLLSLLAVLCLVLSWKQEAWAEWIRSLFALCGLILLLFAVFALVDFLSFRQVVLYRMRRDADSVSERVRLAQALSELSGDQINLLSRYSPFVDILPGFPEPIATLRIDDEWGVPLEFAKNFFKESTGDYLVPVRTWSSGSKEFEYAVALTNHLCTLGFAEPANGNKPARWLKKDSAIRWLALDRWKFTTT